MAGLDRGHVRRAVPLLRGLAASAGEFYDDSEASFVDVVDFSDPSFPASTPQTLFKTERNEDSDANMAWNFTVDPGIDVEVRLGLAEVWNGITAAGQRVFDVQIDGVVVEEDVDVFAELGNGAAVVKDYVVTTDADGLDVVLLFQAQRPAIKSIEILDLRPRTVTLDSPAEGATIVGDEVTVAWTELYTLDSDHVHAFLDGVGTDNDQFQGSLETSPHTFTGVAPGEYTLSVTAADNLHNEYLNPEATDSISITVEEPAPPVGVIDFDLYRLSRMRVAGSGSAVVSDGGSR